MLILAVILAGPADNIGKTLVDNTQAYFTLGLRNKVMKCILCQDREYFDFHQAGVLQERLNRDTQVRPQGKAGFLVVKQCLSSLKHRLSLWSRCSRTKLSSSRRTFSPTSPG